MTEFPAYNDQELWLEIKQDNYKAFDELINRYWKYLYNSAYKRLQQMEVSQDLVQDLFLYIWEKRKILEIENLEAYLRTSVRYRVYNHFSRSKPTQDFISLFENIIAPTNNVENNLLYTDLKKLVRAWIETLPPKRKKIFILYLENNLTAKEIAEQLHISPKTVRNQLNRSFDDLRNNVSGELALLITAAIQVINAH